MSIRWGLWNRLHLCDLAMGPVCWCVCITLYRKQCTFGVSLAVSVLIPACITRYVSVTVSMMYRRNPGIMYRFMYLLCIDEIPGSCIDSCICLCIDEMLDYVSVYVFALYRRNAWIVYRVVYQ